MKAEITLK